MGAPRVDEKRRGIYRSERELGMSVRRAASKAGVSEAWAKGYERQLKDSSGASWREARTEAKLRGPVPLDEIVLAAREALEDPTGEKFAMRYFGYQLSRWQKIMFAKLDELYATPDKEFCCVNAPPGFGKSTVFVIWGAKQIVLNRAVRILFISRAQSLAERNTMRLRRALERTSTAFGAAATLAGDFGRFKPAQSGDVWKKNEYVVEQMDGGSIEEKEPTVSAFGFDSDWLGNRLEIVLGDDLDSTRSIRNMETVDNNREIYDGELEPRLEKRGLFAIAQQRLGPFDFSAHALSKRVPVEEDDGLSDNPATDQQYHHVIFKAHYEELCRGNDSHRLGAPGWPDGCLLDPKQLTWRDTKKAMNNRRRFAVVYQQGEADESEALVQRIWVDGGRGADGVEYPGCWDLDRGLAQIPPNLVSPNLSIVTCDPSPSRYWSVQWWIVNYHTKQRFLMDLHRSVMGANDFLDYSINTGEFVGLLEDWWQRSCDLQYPITKLIVEKNAAQTFMEQYDYFHKWKQARRVQTIPHTTTRNKADPEYGVQTIGGVWEAGLVRLPGKQGLDQGRIQALKLVDEVTRWPHGTTDDCVMGQWFLEWNLPRLVIERHAIRKQRRPTWMAEPVLA